ncbi:5165_t:CDS:2 [Entrophospora sp. SA101]|nr:5165_t:CDS:2 [Entrophospora sp. SA101]
MEESFFRNALMLNMMNMMNEGNMMDGNMVNEMDREALIDDHERFLEDIERKRNNFYKSTSNQMNKGIYQHVSLELKNRISITDLQLDHVHHGKFLLCRVMAKCGKKVSLMTLVEDPEGDAVKLALYNWIKQSDIPVKYRRGYVPVDEVSKLLPIGTVIIIKNPYYKTTADFTTTLRSDNPSDIVIIDRNNNNLFREIKWSTDLEKPDKQILSADDFRCRGNDYFISNYFASAINEYSNGIELEPNNATLLSNRAEAYLRLGRFTNAITDLEITLNNESNHPKAIYRMGKALCGLKRYQEAITMLRDFHQKIQSSTDNSTISTRKSIEQLLKHAEMLDLESRNGQYNFINIVDEFCEKLNALTVVNDSEKIGPRLDHADYLSNDIEIRNVKKKGRGWVAKCDIPEGTLLMVSKAFKAIFAYEVPFSFNIDASSKSMNTGTQNELIAYIAQRLTDEPDLRKEIYKLYSGPDLAPISKRDENALHSVDINRIEKIVKYNTFSLLSYEQVSEYVEGMSLLDVEKNGTALWILPSYFNHACVDNNVSWVGFGDLMILRTSRLVLKGEELVLSYCSSDSPYEERCNTLKDTFGINCQCRLCKLEGSEPSKVKRRRDVILETFTDIKSQVRMVINNPQLDASHIIHQLEKMIDELHDLRKEHPELNFPSFLIKSALATVYGIKGNTHRSISLYEELYKFSKKAQTPLITSNTAFQISFRYFGMLNIKQAKKWFNVALKDLAEPIRGKFKNNETGWRKEALHYAENLTLLSTSPTSTLTVIFEEITQDQDDLSRFVGITHPGLFLLFITINVDDSQEKNKNKRINHVAEITEIILPYLKTEKLDLDQKADYFNLESDEYLLLKLIGLALPVPMRQTISSFSNTYIVKFVIKSALAIAYAIKRNTQQSVSLYEELYNFSKYDQTSLIVTLKDLTELIRGKIKNNETVVPSQTSTLTIEGASTAPIEAGTVFQFVTSFQGTT